MKIHYVIRKILFTLATSVGLLIAQGQTSEPVGVVETEELDRSDVNKYTESVAKQAEDLYQLLTRKSEKYLKRLLKNEERIVRLIERDSVLKTSLPEVNSGCLDKLNHLNQQEFASSAPYNSVLDSLQTSLKFISVKMIGDNAALSNLASSMQSIQGFSKRLNNAEGIKTLINERQTQLKEILSRYSKLPPSLVKSMKEYQENAYYYKRQVEEIRSLFNNPDKIVKKTLAVLRNVPAFNEFMSKHSMLASLFPTPDKDVLPAMINGLQTRSQIQQIIQSQIGDGAENSARMFAQQMKQAGNELMKQKDKILKMAGKDGVLEDFPEFKPSTQQTKTFWQRLQFGMGLQTAKSSYYFPVSSDISFMTGYKLTDKKIIGVAVSGKIGWGRNWRNIRVTGEGIGSRFFAEWNAKGQFWLIGSAEYNYLRKIDSLSHLKNYRNWTKAGMIGIGKSYQLNKKIKGKVQFLYDLFHRNNYPATDPFAFRFNYTL